MWSDSRVNCVLFYFGLCVSVLHCKHTALHGCAMLGNHREPPSNYRPGPSY
ncbi:unnamed protein product [Staurois parvus]|uniref:Uncharacterized protein n=1 Tax=Staurois parvus TaxID=386267 RepID=A0ABN9H0F2_9NEOB|nr:unnamed protein product [Staurois parvus]